MFRLALVNPNKSEGIGSAAPPLNLGVLANYLRKFISDIDIIIVDGMAGQNIKKMLTEHKPNLIGLTSTTPTISRAYDIADWIRNTLKVPLVMGGVHVSVMSEEALKHADYVIVGEGEIALLELVQKMMHNDKITERIIKRPYIKNLDDVPAPAWDLMDIEFYIGVDDNTSKTISYTKQDERALTIITSRGCPYKCIFCHNSWRGTPTRYHSAKRVVEDMTYLYNTYGVSSFFFGDDEFILNRDRFEEVARLLKESGLNKKLNWGCQARADILLRYGIDYITLIKESGGNLIAIGCESGNPRMLKLLKNDSTTVQQNMDAINLCKKAGVRVSGSFMIGTPSETKEEMLDTLEFIQKAGLDSGGVGISTPFPGTKLWQICKEKNLIPPNMSYDKYRPNLSPKDALIVCDTMSRKEFIKLYTDISAQVGEIIYYKKVTDNGVPIIKTAWNLFKRKPLYVISYPFRKPKETFGIIKSKLKRK